MNTIFSIHLGGADAPITLHLPSSATAAELLAHTRSMGFSVDDSAAVYPEDGLEPLAPHDALAAGDGATVAYFVGRRALIRVTVGYSGERVGRDFSPATKLRTVEQWAARELDAPTRQPHRLALRYADTILTPDEDSILGTLDKNEDRDLHFDLVVEEGREADITIIVNAREMTVSKRKLSFAEVVALAYPTPPGPDTIYSVTYREARPPKTSGTLAEGGFVEVKNKTTFNVKATDRS